MSDEEETNLLDEAIGGWVRDAIQLEVESREDQWASFNNAVMVKAKRAVEALDETPLAPALKAEVEAEVAVREGEWSAFSASVSRRIAGAERVAARMPSDVRAIGAYRFDVRAEVDDVEARFEHELVDSVEQRITEYQNQPPLLVRWLNALSGQLERLTAPVGLAIGGVGAAAVAASMLVMAPGTTRHVERAAAPAGVVTVDDVSFEGMVTVIEQDGMAVIWVANAAS